MREIENAGNTIPPPEQIDSLIEYYRRGYYVDAEKLARSITKNFFSYQFGWKMLGAVFGQMGKITEALTSNKRAIQLVPEDPDSYNNFGVILKQLGRLKEAETSYRKAISLKLDFVNAYSNLGNVLQELSKLEEAKS